ncbi:MAG: serine--tRNA ligase [Patescibacteria group bacterium]|nr:serine--tRNA ligase [Patescibacteria group bacterium]
MLDIKYIRENPDKVAAALKKRGRDVDLSEVIKLDRDLRKLVTDVDKMRADMNRFAHAIRDAQGSERLNKIGEATSLKDSLKASEKALELVRGKFQARMYKLPNIPFDDVPVGFNEAGNKILRKVSQKTKFSFKPKDYLAISNVLDIIDTERAAKVSGTRFGYLKGQLVKIQFNLISYVFKRLTDEKWLAGVIKKAKLDVPAKAFIPMVPPVMIRGEVFKAMGKLDPGQEEERYYLPKDKLYLIGSAEHTLGPYFMDETFKSTDLPVRLIGYSTCFRREAGSYGKDTKGILRVHQFDKLEMFSFSDPKLSRTEHKFFLAVQEAMMQELKLPYQVVHICTGDMVSTDAEQFDIESWLPGQNNGAGEYRETHSCSNSTDFQSRRLNIKYTDGKKTEFVHTLNGTAFAIGRTLIALIENYQTKEGNIKFPKVLLS